MKKLIIVALVLALLLPAAALSDLPDISGLSYEELAQLKDQIALAIWNSEEWEEVTVPAGTWEVGKDIPAGHWQIRIADHGLTNVWYCEKVDELGQPVCFGAKYIHKELASEDFRGFKETYNIVIDYDLKEGWFLYYDAAVIFSPYAGHADFGFKKKEAP